MKLTVLQIATSDLAGGAERSAFNLHKAYLSSGHESWLAVGHKRSGEKNVLQIPNDEARSPWVRHWRDISRRPQRIRGLGRAANLLAAAGEPKRLLDAQLGVEDFNFPATSGILEMLPRKPDIVHCHNLHGGYFDLRFLPRLAAAVPTILNLRDAWLLSGHCAFSLGCERWKTGCGSCPDLSLFPAVKRDATAANWRRKRSILEGSRVYLAAPSKWLMSMALETLGPSTVVDSRVIPNAVDTSIFKPGDKAAARERLGLPSDKPILLFAANGIRNNKWKDYQTLREAVRTLGGQRPAVTFLALGEEAPPERLGTAEIRFIPYERQLDLLVDYYRAADVYVHAARVESFGNVLLEARACGTPVVATAVGGIVEHTRSLDCSAAAPGIALYGQDSATGILTSPGDPRSMAKAIELLLTDAALRQRLGANASEDVQANFELELQARRFLEWYGEIVGGFGPGHEGR